MRSGWEKCSNIFSGHAQSFSALSVSVAFDYYDDQSALVGLVVKRVQYKKMGRAARSVN